MEAKREEMDFFLLQLSECGLNFFAFCCYFSAFASSARSVLYTLRAAHKQIDPSFLSWLEPKEVHLLKGDPVTSYLLDR
ncbi:MAG TPA: hypothetical protein VFP17_05915 [Solirubrobacterales bacterium]|nr:hypothetical protein [Solirubrobacterales bacterium]